jgi:hypothetical protein
MIYECAAMFTWWIKLYIGRMYPCLGIDDSY